MRMGMRNSPTVVQVAMYSCECRELTQCTALLNTSEPAVGRMWGGVTTELCYRLFAFLAQVLGSPLRGMSNLS